MWDAQLVESVEYTDCISADGYHIKPSDGSILGDLGNMEYTLIAIAPWSTLTWTGSTW